MGKTIQYVICFRLTDPPEDPGLQPVRGRRDVFPVSDAPCMDEVLFSCGLWRKQAQHTPMPTFLGTIGSRQKGDRRGDAKPYRSGIEEGWDSIRGVE
ncbi:hypothetical protein ColTof4_00887 [Colletotrichum tofieldiae]|nr:hypothetical protein ColTof3_08105 [Colletotrichum tofieldiae]GKT68464.1 hypothetical protein ColTof4_00887 [Colletotrichum tofieldiae]